MTPSDTAQPPQLAPLAQALFECLLPLLIGPESELENWEYYLIMDLIQQGSFHQQPPNFQQAYSDILSHLLQQEWITPEAQALTASGAAWLQNFHQKKC